MYPSKMMYALSARCRAEQPCRFQKTASAAVVIFQAVSGLPFAEFFRRSLQYIRMI
jgi:hypothetical protein